jgi:myo-inositol 2-dehydrogenase/D-chiro-inositol 1-dehydrogenase
VGKGHVRRIEHELAGGKVVAVADSANPANAAAVAGPLGARVFAASGDLIAWDGVDAVLVASVSPAHEQSVLQAISAGKPVLCEKPLAPTAEACQRIVEAEQAGGRRLVTVGFMRRFDRAYREVKATLESGAVGKALMVHNRHRNPTVPESYTASMAITDTAIHEIDTLRWLLGEELVAARVDLPAGTRHKSAGLHDPLVMTLWTETGVLADVEVFANAGYAYDIRCELVGELGTVSLSDLNATVLRDGHGARHAIASSYETRFAQAFSAQLRQWIDAVAAGTQVGAGAYDGYAAEAVCDAAVRSLNRGTGAVEGVESIPRPALHARD